MSSFPIYAAATGVSALLLPILGKIIFALIVYFQSKT